MNNLTSWLDSLSGAAARITSALRPAPVTVVNAPAVAAPDNKKFWIIGAVAAVLLVVLLVMRKS